MIHEVDDVDILVFGWHNSALYKEMKWLIKNEPNWREVKFKNSEKKYFLFQSKVATGTLSLNHLIEAMESQVEQEAYEGLVYVAHIKTKPSNPEPKSLLAKIWNECLGPQPIPFDPEARRALIEHGRQHPELKRHIEAWEEMKRTGSKWVIGDAEK